MLAEIVRNGSPRALFFGVFFICHFGKEEMWLTSNLGSIKYLKMCLENLVKIVTVVSVVRLPQKVLTNKVKH